METTKTTKEALQLLGRYIGREVELKYNYDGISEYGCLRRTTQIGGLEILDMSKGLFESFRITSLRSLDEMSEEEQTRASSLQHTREIKIPNGAVLTRIDTPESIHYLESIGIDTMNLKDVTILIKD